jgi:hypothetical protein
MCPSRCLPVYRRNVSTTKIKEEMRTRNIQLQRNAALSTCSFIDLQLYRPAALWTCSLIDRELMDESFLDWKPLGTCSFIDREFY